jgi:hypothetical protein
VAARCAPFLNKVFVGSAVLGVFGVVTGTAGEIVAQLLRDDLETSAGIPPMNAFAANLLGASQWPGNGVWTIKDARLLGALLVYGQLEV